MRNKDEKKRDAICRAAIDLIQSQGFEDTSMSKIAREAGVSPATIYVYFENKEDLLNQIYIRVKREMSSAIMEGFDQGITIEEQFRTAWFNFYQYAMENPVDFAFGEQFANSPLVNRVSKDEGEGYYGPLIEMFELGKREGIFKNVPLGVFSAFVFFPVIGLIRNRNDEKLVFGKEMLEQVFQIAWDAVTE
ncbi:MAG: TetR/AcrR family transcriptional regulator [Acidobacteria bacterium]|nr:MAG: TetR/AcrR family transcriptional regulator [Acidobacteriota bacterium]REJ99253.1 MAG: TetR/AcrR family transcriptional regulator [Acidobacteriota bacterium]REK16026.1 MAG: TetR/AcrR family transcriptional regulator [Acidobacteriota bacterium]REK43707.1 MAG: TetR/AcrR family transcriptional regulator [Acidobacteriota bacterium]